MVQQASPELVQYNVYSIPGFLAGNVCGKEFRSKRIMVRHLCSLRDEHTILVQSNLVDIEASHLFEL
jgi:hypothetical protein